MANLGQKSNVFAEKEIFEFTTSDVFLHILPSTANCGCIRPGSCTICRTPEEQADFRLQKAQQIKDEEDFNVEEVCGEF